MVGTGVGAAHGILIKGGGALEVAHNVSAIILDKTGTLTNGKPCLTDVKVWDMECDERKLLTMAALAETNSEHPIGKAIIEGWEQRFRGSVDGGCEFSGSKLNSNSIENFEVLPGCGLICTVNGNDVRVGKVKWLSDACDVDVDNQALLEMEGMQRTGKTVVGVALNGRFQGLVAVADTIKDEARATVSALQSMGMEVWMVTGDNEITAQTVADELGIQHVLAEASPKNKGEKCESLQKGGHVVAMVGDGINDSIALAKADAGIAIGAGTEIAAEAADIVLVKDSLFDVVIAFDLSRAVFERIKLNFVWAMGYNLVGIPIAAGILYPMAQFRLPPMFAGLAMAFSSVSVVTSSLLLKYYEKPEMSTASRSTGHSCCPESVGLCFGQLYMFTRDSMFAIWDVCSKCTYIRKLWNRLFPQSHAYCPIPLEDEDNLELGFINPENRSPQL